MAAMAAALIVFFIIANRKYTAEKKDNVVDFDFQNDLKF
jgi:hypothetical protein